MSKIAIFGVGGFGKEVKMLIDQINKYSLSYEFIGFFVDDVAIGTLISGFPVLGSIEDVNKVNESLGLVIAVGDPAGKKKVHNLIDNKNIFFPSLVHPGVIIGQNVSIGEGCIICAGCIITVDISIADHVILNLCCTVGHDTIIHNYCSFMPAVNISGTVEIEECVYVGTGAKIINRLTIGADTTVGAGAVVTKSLPPNCTAVGVPAKVIVKDINQEAK